MPSGMDEHALFSFRLALLIGVALIAFFLTGLVVVKKGHVVVVSSFHRYQRTLSEGVYYFWPLFFQTSRPLPTKECHVKIKIKEGKTLNVTCLLKDPRAYYEGHKTLKKAIRRGYLKSHDQKLLKPNLETELKASGFALLETTITAR